MSDNETVFSPQMVSYIKQFILSNNNTIDYQGVDDNYVATSEISVLGSGDENIAEMVSLKHKYYSKKIFRKLEKTYLPICRRQEIQVSGALYLKS